MQSGYTHYIFKYILQLRCEYYWTNVDSNACSNKILNP